MNSKRFLLSSLLAIALSAGEFYCTTACGAGTSEGNLEAWGQNSDKCIRFGATILRDKIEVKENSTIAGLLIDKDLATGINGLLGGKTYDEINKNPELQKSMVSAIAACVSKRENTALEDVQTAIGDVNENKNLQEAVVEKSLAINGDAGYNAKLIAWRHGDGDPTKIKVSELNEYDSIEAPEAPVVHQIDLGAADEGVRDAIIEQIKSKLEQQGVVPELFATKLKNPEKMAYVYKEDTGAPGEGDYIVILQKSVGTEIEGKVQTTIGALLDISSKGEENKVLRSSIKTRMQKLIGGDVCVDDEDTLLNAAGKVALQWSPKKDQILGKGSDIGNALEEAWKKQSGSVDYILFNWDKVAGEDTCDKLNATWTEVVAALRGENVQIPHANAYSKSSLRKLAEETLDAETVAKYKVKDVDIDPNDMKQAIKGYATLLQKIVATHLNKAKIKETEKKDEEKLREVANSIIGTHAMNIQIESVQTALSKVSDSKGKEQLTAVEVNESTSLDSYLTSLAEHLEKIQTQHETDMQSMESRLNAKDESNKGLFKAKKTLKKQVESLTSELNKLKEDKKTTNATDLETLNKAIEKQKQELVEAKGKIKAAEQAKLSAETSYSELMNMVEKTINSAVSGKVDVAALKELLEKKKETDKSQKSHQEAEKHPTHKVLHNTNVKVTKDTNGDVVIQELGKSQKIIAKKSVDELSQETVDWSKINGDSTTAKAICVGLGIPTNTPLSEAHKESILKMFSSAAPKEEIKQPESFSN